MSYKSIIPARAPRIGTIQNLSSEPQIKQLPDKIIQAISFITDTDKNPYVESKFEGNGFLSMAHKAFAEHLPLLISPDDIWHIFLSQVSIVINNDPEKYRHTFVNHEGKKIIRVQNDNLVKDLVNKQMNDEWESIFPKFEKQLNESVLVDLGLKFSTTTKTHYTVSQILVMSSLQSYFEYRVLTMCGIPEIRISGTVEDWNNLDKKIKMICNRIFQSFDKNYSEFIEQCIKVLEDNGDSQYWEHFYHYESNKGSGSPNVISGLINNLFPVTGEGNRGEPMTIKRGIETFPSIYCIAPFTWEYYGKNISGCTFEAGLTHVCWNSIEGHLYTKPTWMITRPNN